MKTTLVLTVAALGFAASVAWAAEAPAQRVQPARSTQAAAAGGPSAVPAQPLRQTLPRAAVPVDTRLPASSGSKTPEVLCACGGGDHFA